MGCQSRSLAKYFVVRVIFAIGISLSLFGCSNAQVSTGISQLAISPDGDEFFFRYSPSNNEGYLMRYSIASGKVEKFDQPADETWCYPSYSRTGEWLAFTAYAINPSSRVDFTKSRIELMHPDGSDRHVVVEADGKPKTISTLSADGRFVLYVEGNVKADGSSAPGFSIWKMDLQTHVKTRATDELYFQVTSLGFYSQEKLYFSAIAPLLPSDSPNIGGKGFRTVNPKQLEANSNLYVNKFSEIADPYISFQTLPQSVVPDMQEKEIDQAKFGEEDGRFFVVMRDSMLPEEAQLRHYVRDIYQINSDKTFKRLTHLNAVQFMGFDVSRRGNYLAFVAQQDINPSRPSVSISRLNLKNGEIQNFAIDFSK